MKFHLQSGELQKQANDCYVIGIFEDGELSPVAKKLNKTSRNYLDNLFKTREIQGNVGQTFLLPEIPDVFPVRILLVGCGKKKSLSAANFRKIITSSIKTLIVTKTAHASYFLTDLPVEKHDLLWKIKQIAFLIYDATYQFNEYKSEPSKPFSLRAITLHLAKDSQLSSAKHALKQGLTIAESAVFTKNLANQPSNVCTPTYLANQAKQLSKTFKTIKTTVLNESAMKKLGMGALLGVAKGSEQEARLISLEYRGGRKNDAPIAFVGKGITFDTGGISLKPAESMVGMKYDMCGAATVLGVLRAVAELKLPLNVVGIIAAAENMPGGSAYKPEDIVKTLSGQTVEVMNTDAEGRLVLCDALTYCERFKPETVIDIATLTGAVVIALGYHATGLLTNYQPLADELLIAGNETYDRAWQLPLWDEYQDQLRSPFADMSNVGGRPAGTITAACFLSRFTKKFHWAHLDVAGTAAMMGGNDRYATGRPVPMLTQFLIDRCRK